jgi:molybdopterin-containing oxidoreductase family membrane subunit
VRRNMTVLFILCIFVNIGMWFERFVIIVTSLARSFNPANWIYYRCRFTEVCLIVGSFAWFFMFFLCSCACCRRSRSPRSRRRCVPAQGRHA